MTTIRKNTVAVVVVQYAYANHKRGDIISQHRSYEAAERAAKRNSFVCIRFADDVRASH